MPPPHRYIGTYLTCPAARGDTEVVILMEPCSSDLYSWHAHFFSEMARADLELLSLMTLEAVSCVHKAGMVLRDIKVCDGGTHGRQLARARARVHAHLPGRACPFPCHRSAAMLTAPLTRCSMAGMASPTGATVSCRSST